ARAAGGQGVRRRPRAAPRPRGGRTQHRVRAPLAADGRFQRRRRGRGRRAAPAGGLHARHRKGAGPAAAPGRGECDRDTRAAPPAGTAQFAGDPRCRTFPVDPPVNEILDQDAIDALLDGLNEGSVDTRPQEPEDPAAVRVYDFSTQTRIVRGRMPTLEMINERLARSLRTSLFRMLRRSPEVEVLGISTPKYADYVPTLKVPTSLNQIRFHPLTGTGLLIFEAGLIFTIIDALFGGRGRHAKIEGREFT